MSNNPFYQTISIDVAPHESRCEWCGQPAVQQLTAIGGRYHNKGGFFCIVCGEEFIRAINSPAGEMLPDRPSISSEEKDDSYSLPIPLD